MWFVSGRKYKEAKQRILDLEIKLDGAERHIHVVEEQRELYAGWLRKAEEQANNLLAMHRDQETKYQALLADMLSMKRDGFNPTPQNAPIPPRQEFPPGIEEVLALRAGNDPALLSRLMRLAATRLAAGDSAEAVAEEIKKGSNINPFLL